MVDVAQFEENFRRWRGAGAVANEHIYLDTAKLIGEYVNNHDFRFISLNLVEDSEEFELFNTHHAQNARVRIYGAIVYLKFAIDDYLLDDSIPTDEQTALHNLNENISPIYTATFPALYLKNIPTIKAYLHTWLISQIEPQNQARAKDLCTSIYVFLTIALLHDRIEMKRLNREQQQELQDFINLAANKMQELTEAEQAAQIEEGFAPVVEPDNEEDIFLDFLEDEAEPAVLPGPPPPQHEELPAMRPPAAVAPVSLRAYFDEQSLAVLSTEGLPLLEKIGRIKASLAEKNGAIAILKEQKQGVEDLNTRFHGAQTLIRKVARNISNKEPLTALGLIEQHRASIEFYRASVSSIDRGAWDAQVSDANTTGEKAKALMGKWLGPLKQTDTMHKLAIIQLVNSYLFTLRSPVPDKKGELDRWEDKIDQTITQLAGDSRAAARLLKNSTIHALDQLVSENESMVRVLTTFEPLITRIEKNQQRLRELTKLGTDLDAFIADYDGFFVKLSLLLSHYISDIFKTDTADKIEKAHAMVQEVKGWERDCQQTDNTEKDKIRRGQGISAAVKDCLINKLTPAIGRHEAEVVAVPIPNHIITKFHLVNTLFTNMQQEHAVDELRDNQLQV